MKLIAMLLFAVHVHARAEIRMECSVPTTLFHAQTVGEKVVTTIKHPHGIKYTPMYKGAIAPVSLDQIVAQRALIERLGETQSFSWPLAECRERAGRIFDCTKGVPFEIDGLKIRPITFRTYLNNLVMAHGDYEVYTAEVVFLIENKPKEAGMLFSIAQDFSFPKHCAN